MNTRSSIEIKIVETNNFILFICWMRYFLKTQEYNIEKNILFQNNKTSILLEKNNKFVSTKRTKYINIYYFLLQTEFSREKCLSNNVSQKP